MVPKEGSGSSFDGMQFAGRGTKMQTLQRWQVFRDSSFYKSLFDAEIRSLSERIFGYMSGTEQLFNHRSTIEGE